MTDFTPTMIYVCAHPGNERDASVRYVVEKIKGAVDIPIFVTSSANGLTMIASKDICDESFAAGGV